MQTRLTGTERKEQIIEVAAGLFAQTGFSSTRTRDIAKSAGINEAVIYQHFRSKEELYDAAINKFIAQIKEIMIASTSRPDTSLRELLTELANNAVSFTEENVSFTRMLFFSALQEHRFSDKFYESITTPVLKILSSKIEQGRSAGQFRQDLHSAKAAFIFLSSILMFNIARNIIKAEDIRSYDRREYIEMAVNTFLKGIERERNGDAQ